MAKWKNKRCSRCGGTTIIDRDIYGWYEFCIMCAKRTELKIIIGAPKHVLEKEESFRRS